MVKVDKVPWLSPRPGHPLIGWSGVAWSLAGATYRMHAVQGIGESLGVPGLPLLDQHKPWLKALAEENNPVAYMKLDGDSVGKALGTLPGLRAPEAGLQILHRTFEGLLEGTRKAIEHWECVHVSAPIPTLPIDLIYLGGDDLMCSLPKTCLEAFLTGFEKSPKPEASPTFSGAVIEVPSDERGASGLLIPEVAALLVPKALKWVKSVRRGQIPSENLRGLQRQALAKGFRLTANEVPEGIGPTLTVWRFDLMPDQGEESLASQARHFAMDAHANIGQLRKYTGDPYSAHLAGVTRILGQTDGCTEVMISAAWLHDVLEDVPSVSKEELEETFGSRVANLVVELTDISRPEDGNRAVRKAKDRDHLAQASPGAQTIKLADLLDNANSILAHDRAFARVFLREMGELLDVMIDGDATLYERARQCLASGLREFETPHAISTNEVLDA